MTAFRLPPDREARLRQRMAGQPDAPPSIQALRRAKALARRAGAQLPPEAVASWKALFLFTETCLYPLE